MFQKIFRKKKERKERVLKLVKGVEMVFVHVPEGEFLMGSTDDQIEQLVQAAPPESKRMRVIWEEEKPQHTVFLPEYWIGKTPVTKAQFKAFVEATGYQTTAEKNQDECTWMHPKGTKDEEGRPIIYFGDMLMDKQPAVQGDPVVQVSWYDTVAFCEWASKITGMQIGLPSEAEWEKAARGTDGRLYPWGNDWDSKKACTLEKHERAALSHEPSGLGTASVGGYLTGASPYGALDMAGNVLELTRSLSVTFDRTLTIA